MNDSLKNIFTVSDLRKRVLYTLGLLAVFRVGHNITTPGVNLAALDELAHHQQYLALEEPDRRYDIGARYGLLNAQLALALAGCDRAEVLSQVLELLASREMAAGQESGR